jgi:FkbM family methyltransferase
MSGMFLANTTDVHSDFRPMNAPLPRTMTDSLTLTLADGTRLLVPRGVANLTTYVLLEQEDWFEDEIRFVRRVLQPGEKAVDVGASYGVYSVAMGAAVGPCGGIWSYEPTPDVFGLLEQSALANGFTHVHPERVAVADRVGEGHFAAGERSEFNRLSDTPGKGTVPVPVETLDSLSERHGFADADFVKIDVEGHAQQVLRGAEQFLRGGSPLVMFDIKLASGELELDLARRFEAMGYRIYRLVSAQGVLVPFDFDSKVDAYLLNLFAAKADRAESLAARGLLVEGGSGASAPAQDFAAWAGEMPYARAALAGWPRSAGWFGNRGRKASFAALAAFARAQGASASPSARFALLAEARRHAGNAADASATPARLMTLARLQFETADRIGAVRTLQRLASMLENDDLPAPAEPFLPPHPRYDRVAWDGRDPVWVTCAIVEALTRLEYHSSFYGRARSLPQLDRIAAASYVPPDIERRRQLVRLVDKLQSWPEVKSVLAAASGLHRNAAVWTASPPLLP